MIITYSLMGLLLALSISNFLIYKSKLSVIKALASFLVCLLYLLFIFIPKMNDFIIYFDILLGISIVVVSLFYIPKKINDSLTIEDYKDLEDSYLESKIERDLLRKRYLKTIEIVDEGIVFYEDSKNNVILSDRAYKLFNGSKSTTLLNHASLIIDEDRDEYLRTIKSINNKNDSYEIKYRIRKNEVICWILEKGRFINSKRSEIIATVKKLDIEKYSKTSYFILDSMCDDETLFPVMKSFLESHTPFYFILFELSNIPEINSKYGRQVGSFVMNDFIKYIEEEFQSDVLKVYRLTGLRFGLILHDEEKIDNFNETLYGRGTKLNDFKLDIAGINDSLKPNYGIIKVSKNTDININDLLKLSIKTLNEAIDSKKRNYSVLGE